MLFSTDFSCKINFLWGLLQKLTKLLEKQKRKKRQMTRKNLLYIFISYNSTEKIYFMVSFGCSGFTENVFFTVHMLRFFSILGFGLFYKFGHYCVNIF